MRLVRRAGYRSEAVYIRSEDAYWSHGTGYVQNLALSAAFGEPPHSARHRIPTR